MATLSGQNIGTNYKGILNLGSTINTALSATLQAITDGDGNTSPLQLSTVKAALPYTGKTANTAFDALALENNTDAASGNQQYSPSLVFTGRGWKTTATAASQRVDFSMQTIPVQGTANPTGYFSIQNSINGAAYSVYDAQFGNEKNSRFAFNRNANNFGLLTLSRVGDENTPVIYMGCGSGPTATAAIVASNGDDLSLGAVVGGNYSAVLKLSTALKATFTGAIAAAALPTTRPATVGDFYQDTAANILANGDKVVGIRQ
tara:strand:+ start:484 stop:1266 length:783 start_codon:yes stop_codon:yes gene_type:complete